MPPVAVETVRRLMKCRQFRSQPRRALAVFLLVLPLLEGACSRATDRPAPHGQVSANEWRIEWTQSSVPDTMPRGAIQEVHATFRNGGTHGLSTENLSLSYHWFEVTAHGPVQSVWDGIRTPVMVVVDPGSTFSSSMRVQAPDAPGDYLLVIDLVRDGVSWFQFKGAPQLTHPVKIL